MTEINNRIEEAVKFLGLGMTEIKKDAGYYFITPKYKKVFGDKFRQLFPQPLEDEELRLLLLNIEFKDADIDKSDVGTFYLQESGLAKVLTLLQQRLEGWVSVLKKYKITVDSPESLAVSVDILIEEAKKEERERIIKELNIYVEQVTKDNNGTYKGNELIDPVVIAALDYNWQALKGEE